MSISSVVEVSSIGARHRSLASACKGRHGTRLWQRVIVKSVSSPFRSTPILASRSIKPLARPSVTGASTEKSDDSSVPSGAVCNEPLIERLLFRCRESNPARQ